MAKQRRSDAQPARGDEPGRGKQPGPGDQSGLAEEPATGQEPAPIEVRPATSWEDLAVMLGPKRIDATVCWCLSYRALTKDQRDLRGPDRSGLAREIYSAGPPPGVLAYQIGRAHV